MMRNKREGDHVYMTDQRKPEPLIPPHGGYRDLKSYQMAEIVFDATTAFCDRFIDRRSRTHDQMVQAARSGKQNIAEGSVASGTSKKTELKLVGVARASLEELLIDFQDFLRQKGLPVWGKDHSQSKEVRALAYRSDRSYSTYRSYFEKAEAETEKPGQIGVQRLELKKLEGKEVFVRNAGLDDREGLMKVIQDTWDYRTREWGSEKMDISQKPERMNFLEKSISEPEKTNVLLVTVDNEVAGFIHLENIGQNVVIIAGQNLTTDMHERAKAA